MTSLRSSATVPSLLDIDGEGDARRRNGSSRQQVLALALSSNSKRVPRLVLSSLLPTKKQGVYCIVLYWVLPSYCTVQGWQKSKIKG